MSVAKSFTAVGDGPELLVRNGESFTYDVSGTFVGTVRLQQFRRGGWELLAAVTEAAGATLILDSGNKPNARVRFKCSAFTSGTIVTDIAQVTTEVSQALTDAGGAVVLQVTEGGVTIPSGKTLTGTLAGPLVSADVTTPKGAVYAVEVTFTETSGAGVWTGGVAVPAGATILDIIVNAIALWTSQTSASMDVGDTDVDGYFTAIDLKANDLLAGESISFALAGGKAGAYIANSQVSPRYSSSARTINGIITKVGTTGTAGRTRMTVVYQLPVTADIVAATKV